MSAARLRPAAFLDRDGVLNLDTGYPHRLEDLRLTPTAAKAVRLFNEADHLVVVVSNQSGVARGLFGLEDVERFNEALSATLARSGGRVDAWYFCPFHREGVVPGFAIDHPDRKPNPGMILRALHDWSIDPAASVLIGDQASDMEAARRAGVAGLLVETDRCDLAAVARGWLAQRAPEPPQREHGR